MPHQYKLVVLVSWVGRASDFTVHNRVMDSLSPGSDWCSLNWKYHSKVGVQLTLCIHKEVNNGTKRRKVFSAQTVNYKSCNFKIRLHIFTWQRRIQCVDKLKIGLLIECNWHFILREWRPATFSLSDGHGRLFVFSAEHIFAQLLFDRPPLSFSIRRQTG